MLRRVPVAGGPAFPITEHPVSFGAAWASDGTVIYGTADGLWGVPAVGGDQTRLTTLSDGEIGHIGPHVLPSGRAVLFYTWTGNRDDARVAAYDLDTGEQRTLLRGTGPQYAASGHLVFWRGGSLWAVPFDPDRLETRGDPVPIREQVWADPLGWPHYTVGGAGTLLYRRGEPAAARRTIVWVDREGNETLLGLPPGPYAQARLSPDGRRVATGAFFPDGDVSIHDLERGRSTRLTFHSELDWLPTWTPDGGSVVFTSTRTGTVDIFLRVADGGGDVERLTDSPNIQAGFSFSSDGSLLLVNEARPDSRGDIVTLSMDGEGATEDLIATAAHEESPMVSADGRWIAYVSDESGRNEVWARPFPNVDDGRWQISTGGGIMPVWAQDGGELFYQVKENADAPLRLMAAAIETEPTFRHGRPRALFEGPYYAGIMSFDVSSDDERFLENGGARIDHSAAG